MQSSDSLHPLLRRQLETSFGGATNFPPGGETFLRAISAAYFQADLERQTSSPQPALPHQDLNTAPAPVSAAFQRVVASSPDGIFLFTHDLVCTEWNPAMTYLTGLSAEDVRGKPILAALKPLRYQDAASLKQVLLDQIVVIQEHAYPTAENEFGYISGYLAPLRDQFDRVIGGLGVLRDVTRSRQAAQELQTHLRETMLMNRVLAASVSTLDIKQVLQNILVEIAGALEVPQTRVSILNVAQDQLTIIADFQAPEHPSAVGLIIPIQNNLATQYVLQERKPLAIKDAPNDPRLEVMREIMLARRVASIMLVPLIVRDRVLGTLGLDSYTPREFSSSEVELVEHVAAAVAQALENAQLYSDLQQERAYLLLANDAGRELAAEMSIVGVAEVAIRYAARLGAEFGYVLVVEDSAPILFKSNYPPAQAWSAERTLDFGKQLMDRGLEHWVLNHNTTVVVPDTRHEPRWLPAPETALYGQPRSVIVVPFDGARSTLKGVLGFHHAAPDQFDARLVRIIELVARDLATALENARLFEKMQAALAEREHAEQERLAVERKMLEAQKLESLGVLAGGIAHDFNNLLVGLLGHAGLALLELPPDVRARQHLEQIQVGAQRAFELTRQMLAYSGKGRFIVEPVDVNQIIQEMVKLLRVSIPKRAAFQLDLTPTLPQISADVTQLRQVVMNLIMNAADALGDRDGTITLSTWTSQVDAQELANCYKSGDMPAGQYVFLQVADTGVGMDAETQARIFEPFFTTKFTGRGLGLAAVQGIIRGHNGAIQVTSVIGQGTAFCLLFPVIREPAQPTSPFAPPEAMITGNILVVDDEEAVRQLVREVLQHFGYQVQTAENGSRALELAQLAIPPFDCVLLDLTMPGLSSEDTLRALRQQNPRLCVIVMTGFTQHEAMTQFSAFALDGFLEKPFMPQELHARLQTVFARRAKPPVTSPAPG